MARKLIKKWLEARGYALVKLNRCRTLAGFLESRGIDLVLDVGANVGQFGQMLREIGYTGRIISFEPVAAVFAQLSQVAAEDPLWEVRDYALGAAEGVAEINVSDASDFSSIKTLAAEAEKQFPRSAVVQTETIRIKTLASLSSEFAGRRVFLKIDTQGFEKEVLDGSGEALSQMWGVQLEVPIFQVYEGNWKPASALEYMSSRGFCPAQITPTGWMPRDIVSMTEIDCIFRRIDPEDRPGV